MESLKQRILTHLDPPSRMTSRLKPRIKSKKDPLDPIVGTISEELEVPQASEVVFRKTWQVRKFNKTISKRDSIDSPIFRCSVNGMTTFWNISIRFWKGPNGKKVTNPIVICLNLTGCETEETGQARIRFQFGVWDASIKHWECCPISNVVLNLQNTQELLSVGYKSLGILERHIDNAKDVCMMVKIQVIQSEDEKHSLSQDLARILKKNHEEYTDTIVECGVDPDLDDDKSKDGDANGKVTGAKNDDKDDSSDSQSTDSGNKDTVMKVNSLVVKARSPMLGVMLAPYKDENRKNIRFKLDLSDIGHGLVREIFRYIYTDKVDNAETHANKLLPLSAKFCLPGLQALCERALLESITPSNVANILMLADQCKCENLRKAALHYCEDSETIKDSVVIGKTLAWRVMEMVNPDLYLEACETIGSSSSALDSPSTAGSFSDF